MKYFYRNSSSSSNRPNKGRSLICFPDSYCVLDTETSGLNPRWDSLLEISLLTYENNELTDTWHTFVLPEEGYVVPAFITELTGITSEMLVGAPSAREIAEDFLEKSEGRIIIGHNVNFDINFIYDQVSDQFSNDFVDTLRISRSLVPDLPSHRLSDLAAYYQIPVDTAHRSTADCLTTQALLCRLREDAASQYGSTDDYIDSLINKRSWHSKIDLTSITAQTDQFDPDNPFFGKNIVFTGALQRLERKQAAQIVVNMGGTAQNSVTRSTNFLVVGDTEYRCNSGLSAKQKKAQELILKGCDLQIIPENVFYEMIHLSSL